MIVSDRKHECDHKYGSYIDIVVVCSVSLGGAFTRFPCGLCPVGGLLFSKSRFLSPAPSNDFDSKVAVTYAHSCFLLHISSLGMIGNVTPSSGSRLSEVVPCSGPLVIGTAAVFACSAECEDVPVAGAIAAGFTRSLERVDMRGCEPRSCRRFLGLCGSGGFRAFFLKIIVTGDDLYLAYLFLFVTLIAESMIGRCAANTFHCANPLVVVKIFCGAESCCVCSPTSRNEIPSEVRPIKESQGECRDIGHFKLNFGTTTNTYSSYFPDPDFDHDRRSLHSRRPLGKCHC